jgi:hypothetical protein
MSDQEEHLERLEYLKSSKRYYDQKISEAADLINAAHSTIAALDAEISQAAEDAYKDPELRFGDIVGSLDFADERRWHVAHVRNWLAPKFVPTNPELYGRAAYPAAIRREALPEKIGVFARLSSTENQRRFLECVDRAMSLSVAAASWPESASRE